MLILAQTGLMLVSRPSDLRLIMDSGPPALYAARCHLATPPRMIGTSPKNNLQLDISMQTESFIAGKDAALESSISSMHAMAKEIYVADFTHLGAYAFRTIVPEISEIYPVDDLKYENNSLANNIREGCDWLQHFEHMDADRRRVYRCIESMLKLNENDGNYVDYRQSLEHL